MHVGAVQQATSQMVWGNAITDELDYSGSKGFSRNGGAEGLATQDQCVCDDSNCLRYSNRLATDTQQH